MKNIILGIVITSATLAGCNSHSHKTGESQSRSQDTLYKPQTESANMTALSAVEVKNTVSIEAIVTTYLQLKNSLAEDNTNNAATAGTRLEDSFKNFDKTALTSAQIKTFEDVEEDARENAEHIGKNGGNIAHQRLHFEMLSIDIYDLIKAFGSGRVLYKYFCQSYNDGKGAFWISEAIEIKNPYIGKKTTTCGTMTEEIK